MTHAKALHALFEQDILLPSITLFRDHAMADIQIEDHPEGTVYIIVFRDGSVGRFNTHFTVEE